MLVAVLLVHVPSDDETWDFSVTVERRVDPTWFGLFIILRILELTSFCVTSRFACLIALTGSYSFACFCILLTMSHKSEHKNIFVVWFFFLLNEDHKS